MLGNSWHKKEKPLLGLTGAGGGVGSNLVAGGGGGGIGAATGGYISEYESGGTKYRSHTFLKSDTWVVTAASGFDVEYLVVAGGGGGGQQHGGAGGAGGFRTNLSGHPLATPAGAYPVTPTGGNPSNNGTYTVDVGAGGRGNSSPGYPHSTMNRSAGGNSKFDTIISIGGGYGGSWQSTNAHGEPYNAGGTGGSGGSYGSCEGNAVSPATAGNTPPSSPAQGQPAGTSRYAGGGGGGATQAGQNATDVPSPYGVSVAGKGGDGSAIAIQSAESVTYAGGGGGGAYTTSPGYPGVPSKRAPGGTGGGGSGGWGPGSNANEFGIAGQDGLGGGGGGGGSSCYGSPAGNCVYPMHQGGAGGDGTVIIRYEIASLGGTAKATGGAVSFWANPGSPTGKTCIHNFLVPGTFTVTSTITGAETVVIGGGGAGGTNGGGGGGAGAYRHASGVTLPATAYPVTVGSGGQTIWGGLPGSPTGGGRGWYGGDSIFNGVTSNGGGGGGGYNGPGPTQPGGASGPYASPGNASGGGGQGGVAGPGPSGSYGNNGGGGANGPPFSGGGGGGAGGAGGSATNPSGGAGGAGVQLPSMFRDPAQRGMGGNWGGNGIGCPGPGSSFHWVCGGGGGGSGDGSQAGSGGNAPIPSGTNWAGGGHGAGPSNNPFPNGDASPGINGTGGGGGAGDGSGATDSAKGGSGCVLIAYPV